MLSSKVLRYYDMIWKFTHKEESLYPFVSCFYFQFMNETFAVKIWYRRGWVGYRVYVRLQNHKIVLITLCEDTWITWYNFHQIAIQFRTNNYLSYQIIDSLVIRPFTLYYLNYLITKLLDHLVTGHYPIIRQVTWSKSRQNKKTCVG